MAVSFEGMSELFKRLDGIGDTGKCASAMGKCCAIVERAAKQKAPKQTGALRRSIQSKVETNGGNVEGIVFTPLEYAPYVEYGTGLFAEKGGRDRVPWVFYDDEGKRWVTSGQKPQPYMRPAIKENREQVIDTFVKGVLAK